MRLNIILLCCWLAWLLVSVVFDIHGERVHTSIGQVHRASLAADASLNSRWYHPWDVLGILLLASTPAATVRPLAVEARFPVCNPSLVSSHLISSKRAGDVRLSNCARAMVVCRYRATSALRAAGARKRRSQQNNPKAKPKSKPTPEPRNQKILQLEMDKKLEADAKFFWTCVTRHRHGRSFDGSSGLIPAPRTAEALFGMQAASGRNLSEYDTQTIKREGKAASETDVPPLSSFSEIVDLPRFVVANLLGESRMRYSVPTPVQKHTVPVALAGFDVLASAQTGSGKTVAFMLPLIARVAHIAPPDARPPPPALGPEGWVKDEDILAVKQEGTTAVPAALILAPTRELAIQIEWECAKLTFDAPPPQGARKWCACVFGGGNARQQLESIAGGVEILVATPGRLCDFLDRKLVSLKRINFLVLDEADRMLDMGFEPQLRCIIETADMPPRDARQTLMFSATFPRYIQQVASRYLRPDFVKVFVGRVGTSLRMVSQKLVKSGNDRREKLALLLPLLQPNERTIIFCNKKYMASWIKEQLEKEWDSCGSDMRAAEIHKDRSQGQRQRALLSFREREVNVLVATDVLARGIDVPGVDHVIQFDLPSSSAEFDSYVHRIGRTARAGRSGLATSFFVPGDETGNGQLWKDLHAIFTANAQPLPKWFIKLAPESRASVMTTI